MASHRPAPFAVVLAVALTLFTPLAGRAEEPSIALALVTPEPTGTYVWHAGDARLFILERDGVIRIHVDGQGVLPLPFLDISAQVAPGGERGLFAIAFDPDYDANGFLYLSYAGDAGAVTVSRFQISVDPNVADPSSQVDVIAVPHPGQSHNGGQIAFGPNDDYLYLSLGDGGGSGDVNCFAQRNDVLLGKLLRIDVSTLPYAIPLDNPFVGAADPLDEIPDEVWAKGFRNPWRFSFDPQTGDLFIGDVGQDSREEIDHQPASSAGGENYGWKVMEGTNCFDPDPIDEDCPPSTPSCFDPSYTPPVHEYAHGSSSDVCAIVGGFVYRGSTIPNLYGRYLFGDFCSGFIWTLEEVGPGLWGNAKLLLEGERFLQSFGVGADGEMYAATQSGVYKLVPGAGHTPQSRRQQACINTMNKRGAEVLKTRGRSNVDCLKYAATGRLHLLGLFGTGATLASCLQTDVLGRIQRALATLVTKEARDCRDPQTPDQVPNFGYTSAAAVGASAQRTAARVTEALLGADPDAALVLDAIDPAGAACQGNVVHRLRVLLDNIWRHALAGKRRAIAGQPGVPAIGLFEELATTVLQHVDADARGLIATQGARLEATVAGACAGQDLAQRFPGACASAAASATAFAACLHERARCGFCRSFEGFDGLALDCDTFDDGTVNASCPTEVEIVCATPGLGVNWAAAELDCPSLLQYRLFLDPANPRQNADGGIPYDLTTPLFSDYALKYRFVYLPPGTQATYDADAPFDFPVGTIIAKTFSFADDLRDLGLGERVIETRLLIRRALGWEGLPYVWLPDMSDAVRTPAGGSVGVSWIDAAGAPRSTNYEIPSAIECGFCHFGGGDDPIGPKARLLNRDYGYSGGTENQLDHWTAIGALAGAPPSGAAPRLPVWDDPLDGSLETRARAYLESNCHHCHDPGGRAGFTGLGFRHDQPLDADYGVCRVAGDGGANSGLTYAIAPGAPNDSLAIFRMMSVSDGVKMPEVSRSVVHAEGVALVSAWIQGSPGICP